MSNSTTTSSAALACLKVAAALIAFTLPCTGVARTWGSPVNLNILPFASSLTVKLDDAARAVGVSFQGGGSNLFTFTQNAAGQWSRLPGMLSNPASSADLQMSAATGLASLLL